MRVVFEEEFRFFFFLIMAEGEEKRKALQTKGESEKKERNVIPNTKATVSPFSLLIFSSSGNHGVSQKRPERRG
jgi:hypothetical protein